MGDLKPIWQAPKHYRDHCLSLFHSIETQQEAQFLKLYNFSNIKRQFRNAETIKTILLETWFELSAWAAFQSRIYKAAPRKRQYLHNTQRKPPPKQSGGGGQSAIQPIIYWMTTSQANVYLEGQHGWTEPKSNGVYAVGKELKRIGAHATDLSYFTGWEWVPECGVLG